MRKLFALQLILVIVVPAVAAPPDPVDRDLAILRDAGIGTDDAALIDFFRTRTLRDDDQAKIRKLVEQLGDESFEVRERATSALIALGSAAEAQLKEAAQSNDPEVKQRANVCLAKLTKGSSSSVIQAAAHVLAARKPNGSTEVLFNFLPFAPDAATAETVRSALAKTGVKDGKPDKLLLDALEDKLPVKRLGAAIALYRTGLEDIRPHLMKLLKDPDLSIRFRFALILAESKERDAIPVLIEMIPDVNEPEARQIDDLLDRVAQEKGPKRPKGSVDATQLRDTWRAWWKDNGEKIDFAKLDLSPKVLGRTLIVERGTGVRAAGRVYEIDKDGKVLWQIEGIKSPLEAKMVGDDRVLISESTPPQISERNTKGEVLWQFQPPLAAYTVQRLPDGNTLINCRSSIIEVDKDGKEVFHHDVPTGNCIAAQKLKDGNIAQVMLGGQYSLISPDGKEVKNFKTDGATSLYGASLLPDGGVLVISTVQRKVLRYDSDGKITWQADSPFPGAVTAASVLPNGNVLVVGGVSRALVELDKDGKEVGRQTTEGRPYRAYGR